MKNHQQTNSESTAEDSSKFEQVRGMLQHNYMKKWISV